MTHKHTCKDCGKEFECEEESQRRYCDTCTVKRLQEGAPKKEEK